MVSFSGIKVQPNLNQKHPIHCSLSIQLSPDHRLSGLYWERGIPLAHLSLLFHAHPTSSVSSEEGVGWHLWKKCQSYFFLVFFATSVMRVALPAWPLGNTLAPFPSLLFSCTFSCLQCTSIWLGGSHLYLAKFLLNGLLSGHSGLCSLGQWEISHICDLSNSRSAPCLLSYCPLNIYISLEKCEDRKSKIICMYIFQRAH